MPKRPLGFLSLVVLATVVAAFGGTAGAATTTTQVASAQAPATRAFAGEAKALVFPVSALPAGWTPSKQGMYTVLAGSPAKAIFSGENPVKRAQPIASGITSVAGVGYFSGVGKASLGIGNDIFVYATEADAQAAMLNFPRVVVSKKSSRYKVSAVAPESYLGSDAAALEGTTHPVGARKLTICMTIFRQANVVTVLTGFGIKTIPRDTCTLANQQAFNNVAALQNS